MILILTITLISIKRIKIFNNNNYIHKILSIIYKTLACLRIFISFRLLLLLLYLNNNNYMFSLVSVNNHFDSNKL